MKRLVIDCSTGETHEEELTTEEIAQNEEIDLRQAWQRLRSERDFLLVTSDWTVLGDSPTSTAAWKTYRQALRDLPANTTDPFNPVWPTPPS